MKKVKFLSNQSILILLMSIFLFSFTNTFSQNIIKGTIVDAKTKEPLIGASIMIDGSSQGTAADLDGKFSITTNLSGKLKLTASYVAYKTEKIEVNVFKNKETIIEIKLNPDERTLDEVEVVAKANRESENILLLEQKKALISKETIGAQQLSIQGISDAANAATRVTGVSKQEGSQVLNVRGLGDRYNSSTLNGLPLPSNHAEYKNIDLSLFSSDVIGMLGVEKNFTSNMYSDVAGANIDIVSKNFINEDFLEIGIGTGYNLNLRNADKFFLPKEHNFLGTSKFDLPSSLDNYSFKNSWNPKNVSAMPDMKLSLTGGKNLNLHKGKLNIFGTVSYDNEYSLKNTLLRSVNGSNDVRKELKGDETQFQSHLIGLLNLGYTYKRNNVYFNSLYLNSSDQGVANLAGYIIDVVGDKDEENALLRRTTFEKNIVFVNQLLGDYSFKNGFSFNWKLGVNHVDNIIPDRRHNTLIHILNSDIYYPASNDAANNHRYFHDLNEDEYAGTFSLSKSLGKEFNGQPYRGKITAGYSVRYKVRDFKAYQYNHALEKSSVNPINNIDDIDSYFNDSGMQNQKFKLITFFGTNNLPSSYDGKQIINAGFASLEYNISEKLSALVGLRLENYYQLVNYRTTLQEGKNDFKKLKPFPSFSLKYMLNDKNNLRLAGSTTYTLPQFKETAPFLFEGITDATVGNPYLYPSTVYNGELKWEFFPTNGEVFTVSAFGKYIKDPINKFVMASASNDFSYANSGDWAYAYGLELEAKKNLYNRNIASGNEKLSLGFNASLMKTYQELDKDKVVNDSREAVIASFNKDREVLEGAAPLLVNSNLTYLRNWNNGNNSLSASLVYGYVSERLYLIGYSSLGNQYDKGFNDLQLVVKSRFKNLEVSLSGKNLLNPTFSRIQKNENAEHIVLQSKKGIKLGLGLSYKF